MTFVEFLKALKSRNELVIIVGNSAWLLGDRLLAVVLGAIMSAVIARYLGPASFGILSTVLAYVFLLSSFATLSLDGLIVRELVKFPDKKENILGTAFFVKCAVVIITFVVGMSLAHFTGFQFDGFPFLIVVALASILFQGFDVIGFHFQSQLNGRAIALARSSSVFLGAAVKLILVVAGAPLVWFAATPTIEAAMAATFLVLLYTRYGASLTSWQFDKIKAYTLLRSALPIAISGVCVVAMMQVDKLILGDIIGAESVGIYSAATLVSTTWYVIPVVVGISVAPTLTKLYDFDRKQFIDRVQDLLSAITFLALVSGIVTSLLSDALIYLIFGSTYSAASLVLTIHIWTGLFVSHIVIRNQVLLIEGCMSTVAYVSGLALLSNVALNLILIRTYAEIGAATASLLSWALCSLFFPLAFDPSRRYPQMLLRSLFPLGWIRAFK